MAVLFNILCATIIHPVCKAELKHSTVNPIKSTLGWYSHVKVTEVLVILVICGRCGGFSSLDGSGAACRCTSSDDLSTVSDADHVVSPLSDEAAQVYKPLSENCKSAHDMKIIIKL